MGSVQPLRPKLDPTQVFTHTSKSNPGLVFKNTRTNWVFMHARWCGLARPCPSCIYNCHCTTIKHHFLRPDCIYNYHCTTIKHHYLLPDRLTTAHIDTEKKKLWLSIKIHQKHACDLIHQYAPIIWWRPLTHFWSRNDGWGMRAWWRCMSLSRYDW